MSDLNIVQQLTEDHDPSNKLNSYKDDDQVSVMDNQS